MNERTDDLGDREAMEGRLIGLVRVGGNPTNDPPKSINLERQLSTATTECTERMLFGDAERVEELPIGRLG